MNHRSGIHIRKALSLIFLPLIIMSSQVSADAGKKETTGTLTSKSSLGNNPVLPENILRLGVHVSSVGKMDPHFAAGSQDRALADMVFNGLLRYEPGNAPHIEPDLAQSIPEFEIIQKKQVWTVKLRRGVMFHASPKTEAYELTADDVVFSLRKSADTAHSAYAGEYTGMAFEKIDPYTVAITVERPLSSILFLPKLTNYAGGFIVSQRAIQSMGYEDFSKHPVGTGPFAFKESIPGKKVVLIANKEYFRSKPLLDGVEIRFYPNDLEREKALLAGDADVVTAAGDPAWINRVEKEKGIIIDTHGVGEVTTLYLNSRIPPMDDVRVRKAIAFALDRDEFLETTTRRIVGVTYSPVPAQFLPGGMTRKDAETLGLDYARDVVRARRLLAEAGYPEGFPVELVTSEKRLYRSMYEVLCRQLSEIGIVCHLTVEPHADMHKDIRQNPRPLTIYAAWRPNADVYLTRFFHSESIVVTGTNPDTNFSCYDKVDKLIEAARLETNPDQQINLWIQAQIRVLNDVAAFPIMYTIQAYARRATVDYGHPLVSTMALYPQITENTRFIALE
ncbi:MAG: ABC transporter substrate-binding protein [Pseudomonadota bacterium]